MSDYRVEIRIRNNRILAAMERAGIDSLKELCRRIDRLKSYAVIGGIINLKISPLRKTGEWKKIVVDFATALHCEPEELFTDRQREVAIAASRKMLIVGEAEVEALIEHVHKPSALPPPDEELIGREKIVALEQWISRLKPRDAAVLRHRYGLGEELMDYEALGAKFNVHKERIRQIELRAVRRLREMAELARTKQAIEIHIP